MNADRRPDPNCPYCHGSGTIALSAPFLDRIDESTAPCRCLSRDAVADEERQTVAVEDRDS